MRAPFHSAVVVLLLAITILVATTVAAQAPSHPDITYLPRVDGELPVRKCPVHEVAMLVEVVGIRYGLVRLTSGDDPRGPLLERYFAARKNRFPETNHWIGGGCIVRHQTKQEVYFCKMCREAETSWLESNPGIRTEDLFP